MKVGIDGVLLGAWAEINNTDTILDIGTGSGLIALMLAQRTKDNTIIDAIDIEETAIEQAGINIENSPWEKRIILQQIPLQEFIHTTEKQYDLIISNPPFFHNSLKAPDQQRATARHTDTLSHNELIDCTKSLLTKKGKLCIILPITEGHKCIEYASGTGLYCNKIITVFPKPTSLPKRLLLEFGLKPKEQITEDLVIETEERHQYSDPFTKLVKDFYLKL